MKKTTVNMMRRFVLWGVIALPIGLLMTSCTGAGKDDPGTEYAPNMYHSVPYDPLKQITDKTMGTWVSSLDNGVGEYYSSNPNDPYEMNMRVPPAHTVRRDKYLPYHIPKDSVELAARILKNPLDSTAEVVKEGKELFLKYCSHCHGQTGMGDGKVGERYAGVPAYTASNIKNIKEGQIFHVITMGYGRMHSHASQLSVEERWKIVRYVQVLQNQ